MDREGWRRRIPAVFFLAIVIAAAGALVAGYGLAVGFGVLVGLVLGAGAGLLGSIWLIRGPGRQINLAGYAWDSVRETESDMTDLHVEMRDLTEVFSVDLGWTRAVVPVIATVDGNGLAVQLVTVELHDAGVIFNVDARALPGSLPPPSFAQAVVTDSLGTKYRALGQGQGGGAAAVRYQVVTIPAPPASTRDLSFRIERFVDLFPGGQRAAVGPWFFDVTLPSDFG